MSTFKELEKKHVISFEIQRAIKTKNKKLVSKFIDHLIGKSFSFCESNQLLSKLGEVNPNDIRGSASIQNGKINEKK